MQVLESTDKITPKSVLRHRPIGDSKPPRKRPILSNASTPTKSTTVTPIAQRASRASRPSSMTGDHQHDIPQWQRAAQPTQSAKSAQFVQPDEQETVSSHDEDENRASATRILPTVPKTPTLRSSPVAKPLSATQRSKPLTPKPNAKQQKPQKHQKQQAHPLLYLGIGMLSMVVLWTILSGVIHWANVTLDDLRYGRPRTAQYDVVVGHSDSAANTSHFIVINLNRRIEVIEFPGGDPSHAHIYMGPQLYGPDDDLTPATLSFVDVTGNHKLDMIINVQQSHIVFINDQGTFRQPTASERHQIDLFLQRWKP